MIQVSNSTPQTLTLKRIGRIPKRLQRELSALFSRTAFFLQGQMDISPRSLWFKEDFVRSTGGFFPPGDNSDRKLMDLEPWDATRRDMLTLILRSVITRNVPGDMAEVGVYKGRTARLIHHYAPERRLHLFDTFAGFAKQDSAAERTQNFSGKEFTDTSVEAVRAYVGESPNVKTYVGWFPETVPPELHDASFAFVHLDADLRQPILAGLEFFYPRMSPGGVIVVHDYNAWEGARSAVDDFCSGVPEVPIPMPDKSGSAVIVKQ
jgi:O-methyltransferase